MTQAESSTYQGWSNYETWAVAVWIDNDQLTSLLWTEAASANLARALHCTHPGFTPSEAARFDLANELHESFSDDMPEVTGVYADLLNAALSDVDWIELADHLLSDMEGYQARS